MLYYRPAAESGLNLRLMKLIDEQYTKTPFYGWPRMRIHLRRLGYQVNHKRVRRLMQKMGLQAIYAKPKTTMPCHEHKVYPYLLRGVQVCHPDQVWCADITYVRMRQGFMYLVAIMDWFTRYVIAWEISNTLDGQFCLDCLEQAMKSGLPEIFNTDQGSQFTATAFVSALEEAGVKISMDGRGRAHDNIFIERLWRTVKYEDIYLRDYANGNELRSGLGRYFRYYNSERPHQSLGYKTPVEFAAEARLGLTLSGDSGDIKDKAEPSQPCLTVYPPTSALGSLPSVALSSGWAKGT
jgi:putative transposase